MQYPVLLVLMLITFSSAFTFPEGAQEGVYGVHLNSRGEEIHTLINSNPTTLDPAPVTSFPLTSRYVWPGGAICGCGYYLDPSSCDAAVADLRSQLGEVAYVYQSYYSIRGAVVAFVCNLEPVVFGITSDDYAGYISFVTQQCGRYTAGTYFAFDEGVYGADIGYMQYFSGLDFCGAAEGSSSTSCLGLEGWSIRVV